MTVKKSSIRQEIDNQFDVHDQPEDIDDFENPISATVHNLISDDIQTLHSEDISERFSSLRTRTFNDDGEVKGKSTSRNKLFKHYSNSLIETKTSSKDESDESYFEESENEEKGSSVSENSNIDGESISDNEEESLGEEEEEEDYDDSIMGSQDEMDVSMNDLEDQVDEDFLYSQQSKTSEIDKGKAVQQQIALWDTFLECRIRLQKGIVAFNKFPAGDVLKKFNSKETLKEIDEAEKTISSLIDTLISLYEKLCKQYEDVGDSSISIEKTKTVAPGTETRKRKLDELDTILEEMKTNFRGYQNTAIQKWNDKTKIASGKMNNSNFSAFDQSVLAQIEHILNDKQRLLRRTQQRKSKYQRVGESSADATEDKEAEEYDEEAFDDDDFYHKTLRNYIEKKTVDINDPQKLGKQWMELQKLRSKTKRKVDVKCTKGRRLRYGVHEKLVNFMAPVLSHQWNPESETELFKSLFGTRK